MTINVGINIKVNDIDKLKNAIAKYYDCEVEDINTDAVFEYFEHNIRPAKSKTNVFEIIGGDTDGWFIDRIDNMAQILG